MNVNRNLIPKLSLPFLVLGFFLLSYCPVLQAEEDFITEIILINGLAELVDVNPDGEVLKRYLAIPDYFTNGRSHKRTLRESLAKTKLFGLSSEEEEYIETMVFIGPTECRQSLMKISKIEDLQIEDDIMGLLVASNNIEKISRLSQHQSSYSGAFNLSDVRNTLMRQRTLINDRFKTVELNFRSTNRTSKAIIDV